MNKRGLIMGLVMAISLIILVTSFIIFGFLFNKGIEDREYELKSAIDEHEIKVHLLTCLSSKVMYKEKEINLADLVLFSVRDGNYELLDKELEKNLAFPEFYWKFEIYHKSSWHSGRALIHRVERKDWRAYEHGIVRKEGRDFVEMILPSFDLEQDITVMLTFMRGYYNE